MTKSETRPVTTSPTGSTTPLANEPSDSPTMLTRRVTGRENAREKALRLLVSGRLRVLNVNGDLIIAECRGDSGQVYKLGHQPGSARPWRCTCPARSACSHLHALWAVTAVER